MFKNSQDGLIGLRDPRRRRIAVFERAKENLEENDGAGNTFKATS